VRTGLEEVIAVARPAAGQEAAASR